MIETLDSEATGAIEIDDDSDDGFAVAVDDNSPVVMKVPVVQSSADFFDATVKPVSLEGAFDL